VTPEIAPGSDLSPAVEARLAALTAEHFVPRLWARDPSLWSADPAHHAVIANRLGWLGAPAAMEGQRASLVAFAASVAREGFTSAVLFGMGGSSLAPEVLRMSFGVRGGALDLTVLDDTSPAAVRAVAAAHDPAATLFVVSSKSGSTIEVTSFERYFFVRDGNAGRGFVAITDPGTPLETLARGKGYREVFHGVPDIGGRYSALSPFGLVPAALVGADLEGLISGARKELEPLRSGAPAAEVAGVRLGAALGEAALGGRDKLTLVFDAQVAAFGSWVEQLIAESTGKAGKGIVPVVDEALRSPAAYGGDRVFVAAGASFAPATESALAALAEAGHPVLRWEMSPATLGVEFVRWEIATATAAAILGIDPFDEPNVTEAKQATQAVLEGLLVAGRFPDERPVAAAGGLEVHAPAAISQALRARADASAGPASWVPALLSLARPGDYAALLAYLRRTPERHERLQRLRHAVGAAARVATTLGYGPRYLHSTGQLHKGGPDTGLFLELTADEGEDVAIPGERFGFGALHHAQAAGDYAALERRGRRLMRVHLGAEVDAGLDRLIEAVAAARPL
jgi:glucose-6-phosphate isomerase